MAGFVPVLDEIAFWCFGLGDTALSMDAGFGPIPGEPACGGFEVVLSTVARTTCGDGGGLQFAMIGADWITFCCEGGAMGDTGVLCASLLSAAFCGVGLGGRAGAAGLGGNDGGVCLGNKGGGSSTVLSVWLGCSFCTAWVCRLVDLMCTVGGSAGSDDCLNCGLSDGGRLSTVTDDCVLSLACGGGGALRLGFSSGVRGRGLPGSDCVTLIFLPAGVVGLRCNKSNKKSV